METKSRLFKVLQDVKANAKTGTVLERELRMPRGNTNEPTRALIADCILNDQYPIGSNKDGYFLIDSELELHKVIGSIEKRIEGISDE